MTWILSYSLAVRGISGPERLGDLCRVPCWCAMEPSMIHPGLLSPILSPMHKAAFLALLEMTYFFFNGCIPSKLLITDLYILIVAFFL